MSRGKSKAYFFIKVPTQSHEEMITLLGNLRSDPKIEAVVQDSVLEAPALPEKDFEPLMIPPTK